MIEAGTIETRLPELLAQKYESAGIYLLSLRVHGHRIEVVCDSDSGLSIDDCTDITRYLRFHIDHEDLFPGNYVLEVSSPGLDKPLKLLRQYKKNVGRTVTVACVDGQVVEGGLALVDDQGICIASGASNKKNRQTDSMVRLLWNDIKETLVIPRTK